LLAIKKETAIRAFSILVQKKAMSEIVFCVGNKNSEEQRKSVPTDKKIERTNRLTREATPVYN
jgi:hypothetical protein